MVMRPLSVLRRLATGPIASVMVLGFIGLTFLWFQFGPAGVLSSTGVPLLDSQTAYTPDRAYLQLDSYGAIGRRQYQLFLLGDFAWILLMGITVAVLLLLALRALRRDSRPFNWILALPAAVVLLDWIENAALLLITSRYPTRMDGLASIVPLVTTAKLMLVNVTFMVTIAAAGAVIIVLVMRAVRQPT